MCGNLNDPYLCMEIACAVLSAVQNSGMSP